DYYCHLYDSTGVLF
nr:immunoglobulin light chain junction region [Macaca mulatta]MOV73408.1 immunoglobulin light chain junction region [Macaca mulatta]MOV74119.1 immunoglobulin light chain junction region [Macaca mulatta]